MGAGMAASPSTRMPDFCSRSRVHFPGEMLSMSLFRLLPELDRKGIFSFPPKQKTMPERSLLPFMVMVVRKVKEEGSKPIFLYRGIQVG